MENTDLTDNEAHNNNYPRMLYILVFTNHVYNIKHGNDITRNLRVFAGEMSEVGEHLP